MAGVATSNGPSNHHSGTNHIDRKFNAPWYRASYKLMFGLMLILPAIFNFHCGLNWYYYFLTFPLFVIPCFAVCILAFNYFSARPTGKSKINDFVEFQSEELRRQYKDKHIPIQALYEAFADGQVDFKTDVLTAFESRNSFVTYEFQWWHVKFFLKNFLPEVILHTRTQDSDQVCDHYNRGNDFYNAFLGETMIYTSGIMESKDDSLEEMQRNKLEGVCEKILLKDSDKMLDIGCGWGTLVNYAVKTRGADALGVSLAREQVEYAESKAREQSLDSNFKCIDYRDIPQKKFDKITCLEMAEHVGVRHFGGFMGQVYDMLNEDGIFFLQIAGLRRAWQWEDFIWGLFMAKYIFPGADASCPLNFVVGHLEAAGFEVNSVETIGIHYSHTIHRWYKNWIRKDVKEAMTKKYGQRLYRIWEVFLAWSTIIARQGNSTCFQLVAHKNLNHYNRNRFIAKYN